MGSLCMPHIWQEVGVVSSRTPGRAAEALDWMGGQRPAVEWRWRCVPPASLGAVSLHTSSGISVARRGSSSSPLSSWELGQGTLAWASLRAPPCPAPPCCFPLACGLLWRIQAVVHSALASASGSHSRGRSAAHGLRAARGQPAVRGSGGWEKAAMETGSPHMGPASRAYLACRGSMSSFCRTSQRRTEALSLFTRTLFMLALPCWPPYSRCPALPSLPFSQHPARFTAGEVV